LSSLPHAPGARVGFAVSRTRRGLLDGAARAFASAGLRRTTMQSIAAAAGVAKATLYNHFRTKDDLLVAFVEERVASLARTAVATASSAGLGAALQEVARELAADAALRRAAEEEPAVLAPLAAPSDSRGWRLAHTAAADVLVAARAPATAEAVTLLLRWATSQLLWPAVPDPAVDALARAVDPRPEPVQAAPEPAPVPALGWPST
jgi:AcrR family transcriptional regulator